MTMFLKAIAYAALGIGLLAPFNRAAAEGCTFVNKTDFDVWVSVGIDKDNSIAGIGDNGWVDPDPYIRAYGSWKVPARASTQMPAQVQVSHVRILVTNNGQYRVIPPSRPGSASPAYFPFSMAQFDAKVPFRNPSWRGPNENSRRRQAIRLTGHDAEMYFPLSAYCEEGRDLVILQGQALNNQLHDWLLEMARPDHTSELRVLNGTGRKMLFKVHYTTEDGGAHTFSDFREIESGGQASWRLDTSANGDFRHQGSSLGVGVEAVDPFNGQHFSWGINQGMIMGVNSVQEKVLTGPAYHIAYSIRLN
jgi:hypothetical protein